MKIVVLIARILLGLMFVVFGAIGLFHLMTPPPMPDGLMKRFSDVLNESHYSQIVSALQLVSGLLLLVGRFVPLALVLLGPVLVNILLVHILMAPASIGPGVVATLLWFIVFYAHREAFAGIFKAKA